MKAVLLLTVPPFAIVSEPLPKLPILSPPGLTGLLFQLEPGPVTVTVPVEPAAKPMEPPPPLLTVPPSWNGQRPRAQATDHEGSDVRPRAGYGHRALRAWQIANKPADIGHRAAVLDNEPSCPVLTDSKI